MNTDGQNSAPNDAAPEPPLHQAPKQRWKVIPLGIGVGVAVIIAGGVAMVARAEGKVNQIALDQSAKPVTVFEATSASFRGSRTYVGTLEPWVEAKVGPQMVSAYVDTVLVRPGAVVKRGQIVATLDCRNANASSQAVAMQARAVEAHQKAVADEATRLNGLLDGGFVSPNEAEQKASQSSAEQAQLLASQAQLLGTSLQVNDCVLRAPFDGEIADRTADPGAFVRPGVSLMSIVDRSTVRVVADAPEVDFGFLAPGTKATLHLLATNQDLIATISRRAPAADILTRTAHFEMDVPDPERVLPVGTTADIRIDVGAAQPATEIPLAAATVRGDKATVFVVEGDTAHKRILQVRGEREGRLFVDPSLTAGTKVVTEGRALLNENDRVVASIEKPSDTPLVSAEGATEKSKTP